MPAEEEAEGEVEVEEKGKLWEQEAEAELATSAMKKATWLESAQINLRVVAEVAELATNATRKVTLPEIAQLREVVVEAEAELATNATRKATLPETAQTREKVILTRDKGKMKALLEDQTKVETQDGELETMTTSLLQTNGVPRITLKRTTTKVVGVDGD